MIPTYVNGCGSGPVGKTSIRKLVGSIPENDSLKSFNQVVTAPLSALEVEITGHVYETLKTKARIPKDHETILGIVYNVYICVIYRRTNVKHP